MAVLIGVLFLEYVILGSVTDPIDFGSGSVSGFFPLNMLCTFILISVSYPDPRVRINFDRLDPDTLWKCGTGSERAKMTHKNREQRRNFK
jgi:hypothetical protein